MATGGDMVGKIGKNRAPKEIKAMTTKHERVRVGKLLRRDRTDAAVELARVTALAEVGAGRIKNIEATYIGPTPEHAKQVKFEEVTVEKDGAGREVKALRRVSVNRVKQLYDRGVFTDDTYPACLWYQRQWEACGFILGASAATWGEQVRGTPSYGFGPKTPAQLEARHSFRHARGFIPGDLVGIFELVVLDEHSIRDAARLSRCRFSSGPKAVQAAALLLLGGVGHLLPVRAVGAPGSEPADLKSIDRLRKAEALRDGATVAGERQAAADAAARLRERVDPIFIDAHGYLRLWDQIAAITRLRVAGVPDSEILAGLGE